jgi:hypothetical protein
MWRRYRELSLRQRKLMLTSAFCLIGTFALGVGAAVVDADATIRLVGAVLFFLAMLFNFFVALRGSKERSERGR